MKKIFKCTRLMASALFLLFFSSPLCADIFIKNDNIIDKRAVAKIETIGKELYEKTGINTHVVAVANMGGMSLAEYEKELIKTLKNPYILLLITIKEHKVDIQASKEMLSKFDKDGVLSPYPLTGTILPILGAKKGKDKPSAAILNGYADIADQVAQSYGIKLESSIGSSNKTVINIIKVIFYSFSVITIGIIIYRRRKRKYGRV